MNGASYMISVYPRVALFDT